MLSVFSKLLAGTVKETTFKLSGAKSAGTVKEMTSVQGVSLTVPALLAPLKLTNFAVLQISGGVCLLLNVFFKFAALQLSGGVCFILKNKIH